MASCGIGVFALGYGILAAHDRIVDDGMFLLLFMTGAAVIQATAQRGKPHVTGGERLGVNITEVDQLGGGHQGVPRTGRAGRAGGIGTRSRA
jgi:hypothetical protein